MRLLFTVALTLSFSSNLLASHAASAQSVDRKELVRQMKSGEFKRFPPELLAQLKEVNGLFDEPGKGIIYLRCINQVDSSSTRSNIINEFDQLLKNPQITRKQKIFMEKAVNRLINITPLEKSQVCACSTQDTWGILTSKHQTAFNKMAQGLDLKSEDQKALQKQVSVFRPASEYDPMKCVFEPLGLYQEMRKLY